MHIVLPLSEKRKDIQFLRKKFSSKNPDGFGNRQDFSDKHFLKV